jgi:hypothetical protein
MRKTIVACAITALAVVGTTATAAKFISSKDIADGTIQNRDIKKGAISYQRLTPGLRALIAQAGKPGKDGVNGTNGTNGSNGANGAKGDTGAKGDKGNAGADAAHAVRSLVAYAPPAPEAVPPEWGGVHGASIDAEGVKFGPFANGTDFQGAYSYGLKDVRLEDIANLAYSTRYSGGGGTGAAPYMIIATDDGAGGENHVTFSPNTQAGVTPKENTWQRWVIEHGTVRYNQDDGGAELTWTDLLATHAEEKILYVQVQAGNAGALSDGSTSHVRSVTMEANGAEETFADYTFGL